MGGQVFRTSRKHHRLGPQYLRLRLGILSLPRRQRREDRLRIGLQAGRVLDAKPVALVHEAAGTGRVRLDCGRKRCGEKHTHRAPAEQKRKQLHAPRDSPSASIISSHFCAPTVAP